MRRRVGGAEDLITSFDLLENEPFQLFIYFLTSLFSSRPVLDKLVKLRSVVGEWMTPVT